MYIINININIKSRNTHLTHTVKSHSMVGAILRTVLKFWHLGARFNNIESCEMR